MTEKPLPDEDQRALIERSLEVNMLVEAGAGSGKTESMVRRMVAGIAAGAYEVERMAAVTFTRKAAAELRGRFQLALEKRLAAEKDAERRTRLQRALGRLEQLFAGTIHSFCARLLRERPVEAGVAPGFVELDETEDAEQRAEAWREYVARETASGSAALTALAQAEVQPANLKKAFEKVCLHAEVEFPPGDVEPPDTDAAWKALDGFAARLRELLPATISEDTTCPVQKLAPALFRQLRSADRARPPLLVRLLSEWDHTLVITQYRWADTAEGRREARDTVNPLVADLRRDVVRPFLTRWRQHVYRQAMTLLTGARTFAENERRRAITLNYGDLLQRAAWLLREKPAVRAALQRRYCWLFVDEAQDTDPVQAEVLLLLASAAGEGSDWTRVGLRPGALFVVGDPKQSIYRFTRADIETYNLLRERIGGDPVQLTASMRATPQLCAWANKAFAREFPAAATAEQPAFLPLRPVKDDTTGTGVYTLTTPANAARGVARAEAEAIARYIRAAVDHGERRYGDFLILTRRKGPHLTPYAEALDALDIPVAVSGAGAFGTSPAVETLAGLLHALADPDDAVAVVGVLRGPLFGVSDQELFMHREAGLAFTLSAPLQAEAAGPAADAIRLLKELYRLTRRLPAAAAVERILEATGLLAYAAARSPVGAEAGNLLRAVDRVRQVVEGGGGLALAARALEVDVDASEIEALPLEPARDDVVRLMNLHKAKGLEAPVVFLANPRALPYIGTDIRVARDGARAVGYMQLRSERGWSVLGEPANWATHEATELRYLAAEQKRLLYVAATRAKEVLVIGRSGNGDAWAAFAPHLAGHAELAVPPAAAAPAPRAVEATADLRAAAATARAARQAEALRPSWQVRSVTETTGHAAGAIPRAAAGGPDRGVEWGKLVHGLLEYALRGWRDRERLSHLATWLTVGQPELRQVIPLALDTVERVMASQVWARAMGAAERHTEVPFAVRMDGEDDVPVVLQGVIDLVYRTPAGWEVVDYKTDDPEGRLDELVEAYAPQVTAYARQWARLTGQPVRAGLFFVRNDVVRWVGDG